MPLQPGTHIGPYEILSALGAGGMGEVYRGRDARLNRDVALKILPEAFVGDPERLARFTREAQTLASLDHPNIAHIHGLEESGGVRALVMELVDGEDLSAHIARGALPLAEALPIARQIAEALETAHELGIIHRDLKPANIKVRADGTVKVIDFGLAKALDPRSASSSAAVLANSPTITSPAAMTEAGVILGTAAYMAPEQARGKAVDKRADIWAFGVILWEMLTGQPLFNSASLSETLAGVLKNELRLELLPAETPPAVRRLVARCLERDPKQRLRDIGEARILLTQPIERAAPSAAGARRQGWQYAVIAVALSVIAAAAAWRLKPVTAPPLRRFDLPEAIASSRDAALSPDGSRIAYLAEGHLYVRALDALDAQDLGAMPVTTNRLFWSPDNRMIGFTAQASIRTVPASGGPIFVVCRIPASGEIMHAAWLASGNIVFSVWRDSLYTVPASGGAPAVRAAVNAATEVDFHGVAAAPGDRLIVATHVRQPDKAVLERLDDSGRTVLSTDPTIDDFEYVPPGYLVFLRRGANKGIWAVPFDGGPIDTAKATLIQPGAANLSAAKDGTLLVGLPAVQKFAPTWADRAGALSSILGPPIEPMGQFPGYALSPDGDRAAVFINSESGPHLIVRELRTGLDTRLMLDRRADADDLMMALGAPAWFPSGDRILHMVGGVESSQLVSRRADAAGDARRLTGGSSGIVSPDGRTLVFVVDDRGRRRLRKASLRPDGGVGAPEAMFRGDNEPDVVDIALSRDGRLLAYSAVQPDTKTNVFVTDFPEASAQWLVSEGARRPRFSRDGRAIFYLKGSVDEQNRPKGTLMAAAIVRDHTVKVGAEARLFDDASRAGLTISGYDVAPDGRFLVSTLLPGASGQRRAVIVQNWLAAMK